MDLEVHRGNEPIGKSEGERNDGLVYIGEVCLTGCPTHYAR